MKTTIIDGNSKVCTIKNVKALAFTGHTNIEKCYDVKQLDSSTYDENSYTKCYNRIKAYIDNYILRNPNQKIIIITGMARGVDEVAGIVAMDLGLSIICAVPHSIEWHKNRENTNKGRVQAIWYQKFLDYPRATWVEIKKSYSGGHQFANFARNCFMVDLATDVVSFKQYDSSGTDHCIKCAKSAGKYIGNIEKEIQW